MGKHKPTLKWMQSKADRLAGELCRSRGVCAACNSTDTLSLQWCHIISRTYKGIRWNEDNCLCLCSRCHFRFTNRPSIWIAWLMKTMPVKYLDLERQSREVYRPNQTKMEEIIEHLQSRLANKRMLQ